MGRVADRFTDGFDARIVRDWIADDPDPATRAELEDLLAATDGAEPSGAEPTAALQARAELEDRFLAPLSFGTAGLRGAIAAGPNRMNRAVVIRAAAGLARFLDDAVGVGSAAVGSEPGAPLASDDAGAFSVVIGCDARHGSADFARDTAAVVTAAGGRAVLLPPHLPTPVLAFAVTHLGADAGVMVTASHNPPADNGYKVYLGERPLAAVLNRTGEDPGLARDGAGAQIVPPFDALIAEAIAAVPSVAATPRAESGWESAGADIVEAYLAHIDGLGERASAPVRIVLTSLHGVGGDAALRALERCGFADVHVVGSQASPDPDFPTVTFPNPEEAGALDAALDLAVRVDADLIIAHDPDADRFSAAIPVRGQGAREFRQLTGDEVGLLLGERIAARTAAHRSPGSRDLPADSPAPDASVPVLANSIVSSQALSAVARAHGLAHTNTLTGFKWISRVPGLVFGYEEALGYCVAPQAVRDKDGISASIVFAGMVSELAAEGRTVEDELDRIRARDGVHLTAPVTFRMEDTALIAAAMDRVRSAPPSALAGAAVTRVVDMAAGFDGLPPTDGVALFTADGGRVIIRPSGTEPKLKCYLEVVGGTRRALDALADAVQEYLGL